MSNIPSWKTRERYDQLSRLVDVCAEDPAVWLEFGLSREFRQETEEAISAFQTAVKLAPDSIETRMKLGGILASLQPYNRLVKKALDPISAAREAIDLFIPALSISEVRSDALMGMGKARMRLGEFDAAFEFYLTFLREYPERAETLWREELLLVSRSHSKMREIASISMKCNPSPELVAIINLVMSWMEMYEGEAVEDAKRIGNYLDDLGQKAQSVNLDGAMALVYFNPAFDKLESEVSLSLRKKMTDFFLRSVPHLACISPGVEKRLVLPRPQQIRVGVVVSRCWDVDFGSMLGGLFSHMDKNRFELVLLYNDRSLKENRYSRLVRENVHATIMLRFGDWDAYRQTISDADLDILLYECNWGMHAFTGMARMAPVQCSFLDSNTSSGAAHVDYAVRYGNVKYLPEYSRWQVEKTAMLPFCPALPDPDRAIPVPVRREEFGIPANAQLLLTWQNLYRWRPEDDMVLATLLRRNPNSWLLARHDFNTGTAFIEERWRRFMPDVMDRVRFFHFQPLERLMGLIREADIIVPSPNDTGLVSTSTAFGLDRPIVAWRGLSGSVRTNLDFCEQLRLNELIADSREEYVEILHRLLNDKEWRDDVLHTIAANKHRVFDTQPHIDAFQSFLEATYERARKGLPPAHWCGGEFVE